MNQSLFFQSMGGFIHPLLLMWPFSQLPTKIKEKTLNSLVKHHQPETAVWDNVSVLPSLCMISLTTDTSIMHDGANPGQRQLISSWKFGVSQPFSNVLPNVLNVFHHVNIPVSNPPPSKKVLFYHFYEIMWMGKGLWCTLITHVYFSLYSWSALRISGVPMTYLFTYL